TGALFEDRLDELDVLVVAERDDRVAGARGARGGGEFQELFVHRERVEPGAAALADLDLVGAAEEVDERALAAVHLAVVAALSALTAAGGVLGALEHAGRVIL